MQPLKDVKEKGLSLRTTSILMVVISLIITVGLVLTGILTFRSFRELEESTNDYIAMTETASDLLAASDYLTEEVQCYTVIPDRKHLDNYFEEANVTRRREHAIADMRAKLPDSPALSRLMEGMRESLSLMTKEYYAMRLVSDVVGEKNLPEELTWVELTEADLALPPDDRIALARHIVHDAAYYEQKNRIQSNMAACLEELKNITYGTQQGMENKAYRSLIWMAVLIVLQTAAIFIMMWLTTHLGVNPVLKAVDHIRRDQKLPIVGASEFRYLAGTYNVMYNAYKRSIEKLNFKASHDELTGVYNRAGYDLILSSLDMSSSALLIFDADVFKSINDHFGHETGDGILKKIARVLQSNFRSDDYVCRVGGDEFVVLMVHLHHENKELIETKVNRINQDLADTSDGLPPVSLSVGVAFGRGADSAEVFRQADMALYYVKEHGRDGVCFYSDKLKSKDLRPAP